MIDAHLHLDQYKVGQIQEWVKTWQEAGVERVMAVSTNLASSYKTLELQRCFPSFVHACVGFHPEYSLPPEKDVLEWEKLLQIERNRITAIGEIGLPHYSLEANSLEKHIDLLKHYLDIASAQELPVALHAVHEKAHLVLQLVKKKQIQKAHFHWLKAPRNVVHAIVEAGYYLSVTPEVCYRERDMELVNDVPLANLLTETDGPWQFEGPFKNKPTSPLLLRDVLFSLAEIKQMNVHELEMQLTLNTKNCYQLR
ncbi:TatD family hydrolase [Bacillus solitudinis]|uniref:TatD family hydrolase n=1 Tax=Bacillus solitudinis TaxID=2014074 RepID=UPI000C23EA9A|nr:TatD family hydrolase [Bacillus solitudinis]